MVHCFFFVVCLWASFPPPSSSYNCNPRSEDYPAPWAFLGDSIGASTALVRLTLESAAQTEAPPHVSGPPTRVTSELRQDGPQDTHGDAGEKG